MDVIRTILLCSSVTTESISGIGKAEGGSASKSKGEPCSEDPQPDQTIAVGHSMQII